MTRCAVCDDEIYPEDERYDLPDGETVCTARTCILDFCRRYLKPGTVSVPYIWAEDRC